MEIGANDINIVDGSCLCSNGRGDSRTCTNHRKLQPCPPGLYERSLLGCGIGLRGSRRLHDLANIGVMLSVAAHTLDSTLGMIGYDSGYEGNVNLHGKRRWWIGIQRSIHGRHLPQRQPHAEKFR
jgi:hypothetical protein